MEAKLAAARGTPHTIYGVAKYDQIINNAGDVLVELQSDDEL